MSGVIRSTSEITSQRLTTLLRDSGYLADGGVSACQVHVTAAFNSVVARLELTYTGGASGPANLILKLNAEAEGKEEVAFYSLVKISQTEHKGDSMLVPCLAADFDAETGASHLLLVDVSETHEATIDREALLRLNGVPSETRCFRVVDALARFHATWWNHPLLGKHPATQLTGHYCNERAFVQYWRKHRNDYESFCHAHGDEVPADWLELVGQILEHHYPLWERYLEPRVESLSNLTLTHNDCYLTQFLSPKAEPGPTYLVDFQSVGTDFGARDLVYLMATFWTREQRQRYERKLLTKYHQGLVTYGATDYSLDTLFDDYRLALTDMIFLPLWDTTYGADKSYWWPKLECLLSAYQDWSCAALLH